MDSLYGLLNLCKQEIERGIENQDKIGSGLQIREIDQLLGGALPLPNFLNPKKQEWCEDAQLFQAGT